MADEITLTSQELEDIKDDVHYKTKTTLTLKHLCNKMDGLNEIKDDVKSLKIHNKIHATLIFLIFSSLIGFTIRLFTNGR